MIKTINITKSFDGFKALDNVCCSIDKSCVYGLIGSNGAGKSTFLRTITGIYKPDSGEVLIDDKPVYDNPEAKSQFVFVPDDLYFLRGSTLIRMAQLYATMYESFDYNRFESLTKQFKLNPFKNIQTFSKGMKRQAATILALSCKTKYLFFDETFDGLDPVVRNLVKNVIYEDICERQATAIITSHSLRELEDTCDQLSLLYNGGIVFESDVENLKTTLFKVQIAFDTEFDENLLKVKAVEGLEGVDGDTPIFEIKEYNQMGKVASFIVRGDQEKTKVILQNLNPILFEVVPLSLEEVFVHEMDALGYNFDDVLESLEVEASNEETQ